MAHWLCPYLSSAISSFLFGSAEEFNMTTGSLAVRSLQEQQTGAQRDATFDTLSSDHMTKLLRGRPGEWMPPLMLRCTVQRS